MSDPSRPGSTRTARVGRDARAGVVFDALGDGMRRELFAAIAAAGTATATELAADRPLSRQAVVKHLQVLAGAGLVAAEKVGREQRYRLVAAPFDDALAWMAEVGATWDARFAKLVERHGRAAPRRVRR